MVIVILLMGLLYWTGRPSLNEKLFIAAAGTNTQEAASLIERGAHVNMITTKLARHTPLRNAVLFGDYNMVKLLLSKGADPNACDGSGRSVLFSAVIWRDENTKVIRLLIENGARLSNESEREFVTGLEPDNKNRLAYEKYFRVKPAATVRHE
jgi:ankyrin repeat protein